MTWHAWPAAAGVTRVVRSSARIASPRGDSHWFVRSEEHTSELQSRSDLVCRLLLAAPPTDLYTLSLHDALPISACVDPGPPPSSGPTAPPARPRDSGRSRGR